MTIIKNCGTREAIFEMSEATLAETLIAALDAGVDLANADLRGADLSGIDLSERELCGIVLIGANLSGANLSYTNFNMANLAGVNFTGADLRFAKMVGARLNQAIMPIGAALVTAGFGSPMFVCGGGTCEISGYEPQFVERWISMTIEQAMEVGGEQLVAMLPRIKLMLNFLGSISQ